MCTHLLAHGAMPLKILVLLNFVVQLNIDGMPVKVFTHTTARLMYVLTIAEGTPMGKLPAAQVTWHDSHSIDVQLHMAC